MVALPAPDRFRTLALAAILAAFAFRCTDFLDVLENQPLGVDFMALWAGAKTAARPENLYDFQYVTALQGWPLGQGNLRPFVYPPSILLLVAPLADLPFPVAYGIWTAATFALFAWAGRRMGAPLWMAVFPAVGLVALVGQVTFLIGGLVAAALTLRHRPLVAGLLLGVAAAIKPQMLVFAPLALLAEARWRTLFTAGVAGLAVCLASAAVWGWEVWGGWLGALPRFQELALAHAGLLDNSITPYGLLVRFALPGPWAFLLAPVAAWLVWTTFRNTGSGVDRLIAIFAAPILVSPYALNYEAALFAPAVAAYLARTEDNRWPLYATVACLYAVGIIYSVAPVVMALVLLITARIPDRARVQQPA